MKKNLLIALGLGLATIAPSAFGSVIAPGATAPPDILTVGAGSTLVTPTVSGVISPGTFTANYTESVYSDPSNTFCAGCLDFVYTVNNTGGSGVIERVTGFSYDTVVMTDVGYETGTGSNAPSTVDRSANGNVVGFNFLGTAEINPGQTSDTLVIETNARSWTTGLVSIQDGSAGTSNGLAPSSVPEPVSMGMLGGGLALLGIARWRRATRA